jgi:hypothetical protein
LKDAHKRIDLLEAEQEGNFFHAELRVHEQASRHTMTHTVKMLLICSTQFAKSVLKGARAHPQGFRNLRAIGRSPDFLSLRISDTSSERVLAESFFGNELPGMVQQGNHRDLQ